MNFNILEVILSVFFTALIVSVIFRQIKLSVVLGYLLVGAIVGPNGLGLVPNSEYINQLAEFGIVFLMFTVGLEFSIPKLFALRNAVFIIGSLQVLFCILITTLVGTLLGMPILSALVVGGIVAMSSTALVIKQINEQFELQTPHGLNAVGILLFQDLAVIPIIILIAGLAKGAHESLALILLIALVKGICAIFAIFILGRWLLRPLFYFITKTRSQELFTLSVLLLTLSAAWITHILGLSYALGAFLAGIMLAETEFRHQIEVEIRPFRDVLLTLFFITVGMLANISTWYETWFWILLLVFALVVGKAAIIFLLSRLAGNYYSTSARTSIILAQGGEFGFAILTLAMNDKIISPPYQQVILAALLISIAIAPLLIRFNKQIAYFFLPKNQHDNTNQKELIAHAKKLHNHVIICGYGRIGQQTGRLLDKVDYPHISIDYDSELVQRATLAGDDIIYGDAGNLEILHSAGIDDAKVLIISISDHRIAIKILSMVRHRFPNLPILVRCRDQSELKQLKKLGATHVIAELFEASLTLSHHLLEILRISNEKVTELIQEIRNSDYDLLQQIFSGRISDNTDEDALYEQLSPIVIYENAYAVNRKLGDLQLEKISVEVMSIRRGDEKHLKPHGNIKIKANDIVVLLGSRSNLEIAERRLLEGI